MGMHRASQDNSELDLSVLEDMVSPTRQQEAQMLRSIHSQMDERSRHMRRFISRKMMIVMAAIAVIGTGTSLAAGKITYLSSSHSIDQVDYENAEAVGREARLDKKAKAVDAFSDGMKYSKGFYSEVDAWDENEEKVGSYPSIMVEYEGGIFLDISKPLEDVGGSDYPVVLSQEYEGAAIKVTEMNYLFLPPDAEPSAEDKAKQEAGELEISYGSSQEERKIFRSASWDQDGLHYILSSMDGAGPEELMQKAKEIVAAE